MKRDQKDLIDVIGGCGRFQLFISMTTNAASFLSSWGMMFMAFGIYNPGWTCLDPNDTNWNSSTTTSSSMLSRTLDVEKAGLHDLTLENTTKSNIHDRRRILTSVDVHQLETMHMNWTMDCELRIQCQHLLYNPYSKTIVTEWDLSCDKSWIGSVIITTQMCGVLFGSYLSGHVGDRWGRKVAVYGGVAISFIGHMTALFSDMWQIYMAAFFIIGTGIGAMITNSFSYPLEFMNSRWRALVTSFPSWSLGATACSLAVFILKDFRHLHIVSVVLCAVVFLPVVWTPESIRWLAMQGKVSKAKRIVRKIISTNGMKFEEEDMVVIDLMAIKEKDQLGQYKYTYLDLFKSQPVRGYTLKFGFIWVVMGISFYTIQFGIKSLSGDFFTNLILFSICEIPAIAMIAPLANLFGRLKGLVVFYGFIFVVSLSVAIISLAASEEIQESSVTVLALLCKAVLPGAWYLVAMHSAELYPTVIRSLHAGFLNSVSRIGSMLSPYMIVADSNSMYIPFFIIASLNLVILILIFTLPETKDKDLVDSTHIVQKERVPKECIPMDNGTEET